MEKQKAWQKRQKVASPNFARGLKIVAKIASFYKKQKPLLRKRGLPSDFENPMTDPIFLG